MAVMKYLRECRDFIADTIERRDLVYELTLRDFQIRYLGSYLGMLWAIVHPVVYILILWFICQFGLRSQPVENFPFILWMVSGIVPWFFFSECLGSASNAVVENGFLVKKVVFRVALLPVVKIISSLVVHLCFVALVFAMFLAYGYLPSIYTLQIFYYLFASLLLLLGLSWLTSSLVVFLRDVGQVVNMVLQFLFWMTPIFWSASSLPPKFQALMKLNPLYYIVEGYRNSFIHKGWFWEGDYLWTLYFWAVTLCILVAGAVVFHKLKPRFADVL